MADTHDTPRHTVSNPRNDLTVEYVRTLFDYEPDSGILRWKVSRPCKGGWTQVGQEAGAKRGHRYLRVGIDGRHYYVHRIIHLWMTGEWPNALMDHRHGDERDNRWEHLRPATSKQNGANQRASPRNTSGFKGVSAYVLARGRVVYRAFICVSRKRLYLGTFDTPEEAHAAYMNKAREAFGDFARG